MVRGGAEINPRDVNASTDLGIAYYYMNQPDKALAQFDRSLAIDPNHGKTLLNVGIVRAFGKQDLNGATAAWEKVLKVAPDSEEARAARQALDGVRAAHPERRRSATQVTCSVVLLGLILVVIVLRAVSRLLHGIAEGIAAPRQTPPAQPRSCAIRSVEPMSSRPRALTSGSGTAMRFFCSERCREAWNRR